MPIIPISGNLTAPPKLNVHNGKEVVNFTVAVNSRVQQGDQWVDGPAAFYNCAVWQSGPKDTRCGNIMQSLDKGSTVVVYGDLKPREYQKDDGTKGMSLDVSVHEVGPSLRFNPVGGVPQSRPSVPVGTEDPWGNPPPFA